MAATKPLVQHLQKTGHSWLDKATEVEPDYEFQEFPKHKHHATKASVIVNNPAEEAKLGKGWANSPAAFLPAEEAEVEAPAAV